MKTVIAVIGSDGDIPANVGKIAERIGKEIAERGCILVCGGRGGVMEAVSRGAKSAGGTTIGIMPSMDKSAANKYIDIPLTTPLGYVRNTMVVSCADAVIAINGRVGTLSEISFALNFGKPVFGVKGSGGVVDRFKEFGFEGFMLASSDEVVGLCINAVSGKL